MTGEVRLKKISSETWYVYTIFLEELN